MARDHEKAHNILNRWTAYQHELSSKSGGGLTVASLTQGTASTLPSSGASEASHHPHHHRRPRIASDCKNLQEAQKWRKEILNEATKKIEAIQNPGLGEHRLRELNDEINKLLRERAHWERQIESLGGPTFASNRSAGDALIASSGDSIEASTNSNRGKKQGNESQSKPQFGTGYKYFGAARDLPGVRELFAPKPKDVPKRKRKEIIEKLDIDYWGFGSEQEEGKLMLKNEQNAEKKMRKKVEEQWRERAAQGVGDVDAEEDEKDLGSDFEEGNEEQCKIKIETPSQKTMEDLVLQKRKKELLSTFLHSSSLSDE